MTEKQKAKLVKLIKGDCQLRHKYADGKGRFCVIGSMLKACGVKTTTLRAYGGTPVCGIGTDRRNALTEEFGLTYDALDILQYANDAVAGGGKKAVAERRETVLRALENMR